jgi:threonylcarbamoyladenosine tRNA methylthiotransferase MtaB
LGSQQKFDIISHLAGLEKRKQALVLSSNRSEIKMFFPTCTRGDRTRYFLKVQDGCDYFS